MKKVTLTILKQLILSLGVAAGFISMVETGFARELPASIWDSFRQAGIPEESVAIVIQPLDSDVPEVTHNAEVAFQPASTMKVLTTYAALELLGPSFTWETRAYTTGKLENGVLTGDLILKGSGDPSFRQQDLWLFIRQIQHSGIQAVHGNVVLDKSVFSPMAFDASAFDDAPLKPYNAGPDGLLLNEKRVDVRFVPHPDRRDVEVTLEPRMDGIIVVPPILTESACVDWQNDIVVHFDDKVAYFEGVYPLECGEKIWAIHPYEISDVHYFEKVFRKLWHEAGGTIVGHFKEGTVPPDAVLRSQWRSAELGSVIVAINKYSNNVMARQLLLTLGANRVGSGATPAEGIEVIENWLVQKGIYAEGLIIENGAGLSRKEKITARTMAEILIKAFRSPVMPELLASLPIAGRDGTLSKRLQHDEIAGKAHIKTGAIKDVRALAGYALAKSGKRYLIVCLVNHKDAGLSRPVLDELLSWAYENG